MGRKSEQSRQTYNHMASEYDTSQEGRYTKNHRAELIKRVSLKDGDQILDVACGNGALLAELSKKAKVHATGIDISEQMIDAARIRYPDIYFEVQPSCPLAFEENSQDVITVSCAFHHFEDPQGFADECMRILKAGGDVYLAEPYFSPVVRILANYVVFPFSKKGDVRVYHEKELQHMFEKAGFTAIETWHEGTILFLSAKKGKH